MLSCSIWFSAPSIWMGGGLESRCVGRAYGADGAVRRQVYSTSILDHHLRAQQLIAQVVTCDNFYSILI